MPLSELDIKLYFSAYSPASPHSMLHWGGILHWCNHLCPRRHLYAATSMFCCGKPTGYFLESWQQYHSRESRSLVFESSLLQRLVNILMGPSCKGRLHWGKAGWEKLEGNFKGSTQIENWCHFGCAVQVSFLFSSHSPNFMTRNLIVHTWTSWMPPIWIA